MQTRTYQRLLSAGTLLAALATGTHAHADKPWPQEKPIQLVISASAGSQPDTLGRILAQSIAADIGQAIVVENKPGATGLIGNDAVVRAKPDGYTLLFTYAATIVGNKLLNKAMPHDPVTDLTPIAQIGRGGNLLIVSPTLGVRDFAGLLELLKKNPGKYNYASWGTGSGGHIAMESIKQQTGVQIEHVPYKAMPQILNDLKGGRLQIAFTDSSTPLPLIQAGELIPLATSATVRAPALPDIPTLLEQGVVFDADAWYGILGPKGLSPELVERINQTVNKAITSEAMAPRFAQMNMARPTARTPAEFAQTIGSDVRLWAEVIQKANIALP